MAVVVALLLAEVFSDLVSLKGPGYMQAPSSTRWWLTGLVIPWILIVVAGAAALRTRRILHVVIAGVAGFVVLVLTIEIAGVISGSYADRGFVGGQALAYRIYTLNPFFLHNTGTMSGTQTLRLAAGLAIVGAVYGLVVIAAITGLERAPLPALGGAVAGLVLVGMPPVITYVVQRPYWYSLGAGGALMILGIVGVAAALDSPGSSET